MGCVGSKPEPFDGNALVYQFDHGERILHRLLGVEKASLTIGIGADVADVADVADAYDTRYVMSVRNSLGYKVFVAFFDAENRILNARDVVERVNTGELRLKRGVIKGVRSAGMLRKKDPLSNFDMFAVLATNFVAREQMPTRPILKADSQSPSRTWGSRFHHNSFDACDSMENMP